MYTIYVNGEKSIVKPCVAFALINLLKGDSTFYQWYEDNSPDLYYATAFGKDGIYIQIREEG